MAVPGSPQGRMGLSKRGALVSIGCACLLWAAISSSPAFGMRVPAPELVGGASFRGLSLTAAIQILQRRGLAIVFTSNLVRPAMRVEREPLGDSLPQLLAAILAPHGLRAVPGAGGRLIVVTAPPPAPDRRGQRPAPPEIVTKFEEAIVVTPGGEQRPEPDLDMRSVTPAATDRPNRGDDVFRALGALPGTSMRESSARVHVRGGRDYDVLILLDGLELLAPYHLQEFDSALSIVPGAALERADLVASGVPAEYGDRMGGLLHLTTATPASSRQLNLGLGLMSADANASGRFGRDRGAWYAAARGGQYHLALELEGIDASPRFWDTLAKVDFEPLRGHDLRLRGLMAADELSLQAEAPGTERYRSDWGNSYLWATHHGLLRPTLSVETMASMGEIERRRDADKSDAGELFHVRDARSLRMGALKQVWRQQPLGRTSFEGGFEHRELGSTVAYVNQRRLAGALTPLRTNPGTGATAFEGRFDFDQTAAFATARLRLDSLTSELGLRYDRDTFIEEEHLSPRWNLAWTPVASTAVRLSWGWFYQSQRPNELQVEDGDTALRRAERAEHRVLELEYRLPTGAAIRIETFERRTSRSGARFENLFDSGSFFPELGEDRVRLAPSRGSATGAELGYRSAAHGPAGWRLAYAYSASEESIGGRQVARSLDQRHALNAGFGYRSPGGWMFDTVWWYHTGWPTTAVSVRPATPAAEAVLGPYNASRLPAYHRLDMRLSRTWEPARSRLSAYIDLQNLYDRDNLRGWTDFRFEAGSSGQPRLRAEPLSWGGFLPSFGVRWAF